MHRKVVVHIAASADGYIARPDGNLDWLTSRPAPEGFYGMSAFTASVDTCILGRSTYDVSRTLGATFKDKRYLVFSRQPRPSDAPAAVEFTSESVGAVVDRMRQEQGKNIWLMGGGDLIASFLDAGAIDEFVVSVVPVFIGDGIPLIAKRHRHTPLNLLSTEKFEDGLVALRYEVANQARDERRD